MDNPRKRTRSQTAKQDDSSKAKRSTLSSKLRQRMVASKSTKLDDENNNKHTEIHNSFDSSAKRNATIQREKYLQPEMRQPVEILGRTGRIDHFQSDLFNHGLQGSRLAVTSCSSHVAESSKNILHFFQNAKLGRKCRLQLRKSVQGPVINVVSQLQLNRISSPFDRRVTALEWHPSNPNLLAVGSKGGDILLWDLEKPGKDKITTGEGAGGSCQALKFWPWDHSRVVTASIDGTVKLHDLDGKHTSILADTMDSYDHWYCSVDVQSSRQLVAAGRNHGILHLMSTEGKTVFDFRLHKNKITHVEFSPREDWLLCTASSDQTVQFWDVRMMKDRTSNLCMLKHNKPINSAYFSSTDGCRLLTTDQKDEIRVYRAPHWQLETTIPHPHRFFQHITPFKATWHPLQDLIVAGRYPEGETDSRTIDVYDADTGQLVSQLQDPGAKGLCPLNKFSRQGDALATGMGFHILVWNRHEVMMVKQEALMKDMKKYLGTSASISASARASGPRSRRPRGSEPEGKKKQKGPGKTKTQTGTKKVKLRTKTKET